MNRELLEAPPVADKAKELFCEHEVNAKAVQHEPMANRGEVKGIFLENTSQAQAQRSGRPQ